MEETPLCRSQCSSETLDNDYHELTKVELQMNNGENKDIVDEGMDEFEHG